MNTKIISKNEKIIFIFLALIFSAYLFLYQKFHIPYTYGDAAFLLEILDSLSKKNETTSFILSQNHAASHLASINLRDYCRAGISASDFGQVPYNWLFNLHAYLILFLIAPLSKITGSLNILAFLMTLSFSLIPFIVYFVIRKYGYSVFLALISTSIIIFHPAWFISSVGQAYIDRVFLPLSFIYVLSLHLPSFSNRLTSGQKNAFLIFALLVGMLAGMVSERYMFVIGVYTLFYSFFYVEKFKIKILFLIYSLFLFLCAYIYLSKFGGSIDNVTRLSNIPLWADLKNNFNIPGVGQYLIFNFLLLIPCIFLNPRIAIPLIPLIAINCLMTVGGAEKNGWGTHYHSHYFGFLASSFVIAVVAPSNKYFLKNRFQAKTLLLVFTFFLIFSFLNYFYKGQGIGPILYDFSKASEKSGARSEARIFDELSVSIPEGSIVSSAEWGMPALYLSGKKINYYPVGVGTADYILIGAEGNSPNLRIFGGFRRNNDLLQADECMTKIINKHYVKISNIGTRTLLKRIN
jgi:hypothetical protein